MSRIFDALCTTVHLWLSITVHFAIMLLASPIGENHPTSGVWFHLFAGCVANSACFLAVNYQPFGVLPRSLSFGRRPCNCRFTFSLRKLGKIPFICNYLSAVGASFRVKWLLFCGFAGLFRQAEGKYVFYFSMLWRQISKPRFYPADTPQ